MDATPWKINMEHVLMEAWKIIFLSKWVICRFKMWIFQGVIIPLKKSDWWLHRYRPPWPTAARSIWSTRPILATQRGMGTRFFRLTFCRVWSGLQQGLSDLQQGESNGHDWKELVYHKYYVSFSFHKMDVHKAVFLLENIFLSFFLLQNIRKNPWVLKTT